MSNNLDNNEMFDMPYVKCIKCGITSYHPEDVEEYRNNDFVCEGCWCKNSDYVDEEMEAAYAEHTSIY